MYLKNILVFISIIFFTCKAFGYAEIRAENNAYRHNNKGLIYLKENYYFGAIKEFEIAINLMPNAQGSAAYYVNLGTTYEKMGYPALAAPCYEKAVKLHPLYFDYYKKLANCYSKMGIANAKIDEYKNQNFNPLNDIMIGLLYIENGEIKTGVTLLDNFCNEQQDLIITTGVKEYIKDITKK